MSDIGEAPMQAHLTKDDLRAAIGAGTITEAQAASLAALADARVGARANLSGLDEPFELFRGFNEIFIVVGLSILYFGWWALTGLSSVMSEASEVSMIFLGLVAIGVTAVLARYFTLIRRMVAPSIALAIFFAGSVVQIFLGFAFLFDANQSTAAFGLAFVSIPTLLALLVYWRVFHVPFTMLLIGVATLMAATGLLGLGGGEMPSIFSMVRLSGSGTFGLMTFALGILGTLIALRFDMSDPHRVTRRSANGFWLHVIAAPAVVNTVALNLLGWENIAGQLVLLGFIILTALFAIVIDRRSFLVAGVGYIVGLSFTVMDDAAPLAILLLGALLVFLGAKWEAIRGSLMAALPNFPGKDKLPPWSRRKDLA